MRSILIANRGEIALRIMRTARKMGISTVAVFSDADADAPFVAAADTAVALGGNTAAESYLRGDAIIEAARRSGADAVHPGYGFLAENAEFAASVEAAGLLWVGPSPTAIAAMGSKIEAKRLMQEAGVPVLPGQTITGADGESLTELAAQVGYPLLVKASAGGGGKGMRIARSDAEIGNAVAAARREAMAAFGDETAFLERFVEAGRHVEIQIFGDSHGNVVSLFERECSIQRRHQKILEESPSTAVDEKLRKRMGDAAVAAGKALGYCGAGTVEFILAPDGEFFFLEVNTRLQVEHPVTEAVTGLDLVRLQLLVATGGQLPAEALDPQRFGHAIEVRLYAEDPLNDFLPQTGTLARVEFPSDVRAESGVRDGSEVSVYYDPMLAKLIAHAPSREEAARCLATALRRSTVHGVTNNRDFLVRLLEHPEFLAGDADTSFLDRHDPSALGAPLIDEPGARLFAAAAALAERPAPPDGKRALAGLPRGWRNVPSQDQVIAFSGPYGQVEVAYRFDRGRLGHLRVDDVEIEGASLHTSSPHAVVLEAGGVLTRFQIHRDGQRVWINTAKGQLDLVELDRFPAGDDAPTSGSLESPMPGIVARVCAEAGAAVERGAVIVVIEAMKMEHEIVAPLAGTISELRVAAGDQVETGAVLAVVDGDETE
ncbi:MAG: biotin carboxylase N-terminal domain-containing protein [Solirubrobacterales bacterium]